MVSPKLMFTSESVTEGHPDKLCDQVSDAVLDACIEQDPMSRVACETATKTGVVILLGEITTHAYVNFDELVRRVVKEIGYDSSEKGFDGNTCAVLSAIASQSPDIDMGVSKSLEAKGGDDV
jgi:S-adenosylmethionine synthetase